MMLHRIAAICLWIGVLIIVPGSQADAQRKAEPVQVILDTDMETDCDDAGALAVLHTLADRDEIADMASGSQNEKGSMLQRFGCRIFLLNL